MDEPIALQDLFFGTMSGAAIVLMGAFYALFFALGRLHKSYMLTAVSLLSFAMLCVATFVLIDSLSMTGFWLIVAGVMLVGYFLLPRAIWKLCIGTHAEQAATTESRATL